MIFVLIREHAVYMRSFPAELCTVKAILLDGAGNDTKMENLYLIESFLSFVSEEDWQNDKGRNQQNEQGN